MRASDRYGDLFRYSDGNRERLKWTKSVVKIGNCLLFFFGEMSIPKINRFVLASFHLSTIIAVAVPFIPQLKCAFECTIRRIPINRNRNRIPKREQRERKWINQLALIVDNSSHTYRYLSASKIEKKTNAYTHLDVSPKCALLMHANTKPFKFNKTLFLFVCSSYSFRFIFYFSL